MALVTIALWVDDLMIFAKDKVIINDIKTRLNESFKMKDLGELEYFLGIQVNQDQTKNMIKIDQESYVEKILQAQGMQNCKSLTTPLDPGTKLCKNILELDNIEKAQWYQQAISSLMYVMLATQPDLAYTISTLSQYSKNPKSEHWNALHHVMRYLQATKPKGLVYSTDELDVYGYADADWGGHLDMRCSTMGYLYISAGGAVSWTSRRQSLTTLSMTEAEYMSVTQVAKEAIWLTVLLKELEIKAAEEPMIIKVDNQGSIHLAKNPEYHARTKHIDIQHHFI